LADLVVVNKADGDLAAAAKTTAADYAAALHLVRPRTSAWSPHVLTCSALLATGIAEVWAAIETYCDATASELTERRADQARAWMWSEVTEALVESMRADPVVSDLAGRLEADVAAGAVTPTAAAQAVLQAFLQDP
ncbi:MAG TPA: methylmalonyl Co-A mutase-associated GTPase MeaB, partial [Acidimicrobiia bacterium]|nr:methylmalonyl Co-A mutase-associated GTPase MeaB [Acidimicrobiia bacterium]